MTAAEIVLLHGVGLDRTMWQELTAIWPDAGQHAGPVIALDLPGHGAQPPLRSRQSLDDLAADVLARMPAGPVHLVGFSLGALIAQRIAASHPERVLTLACVNSVCRRTDAERAAVDSRLRTAGEDFAASVDASITRWFPTGTAVPDAVIERTRRTLLANDVESYLHAYRVFAQGDAEISPDLDRIGCPVLAITGADDPGSTPEMSQRLAAAVPRGRVVIAPDARHMLPVQHPEALREAITELISESKEVTR